MSLKFEPLSLFFFFLFLQLLMCCRDSHKWVVGFRIVQDTGFSPDFDSESAAIAAGRPNVQNRTLYVSDWWGGGVLHAKLWISNKKHAYVGSANNDWKSLTQVSSGFFFFFFYGMVLSHWWQQPKTSGSVFLLVQNLVEASVSTRKNSSTLNLFTPSGTTHFLNLLLVLLLEWRFLFLPPFVSSQSKLQKLCSCSCLHLLSLSSSSHLDIGMMRNQICAEA